MVLDLLVANMNKDFESLWVEKYRPTTLKDIVLSLDDRTFLESLSKKQEIPHLLFAGPAGVGKTTTAKVLASDVLDSQYLYINASDENGIDIIRGKITSFAKTMSLDGKIKIVLLDEFDAATLDNQKALRNVMEEYAKSTRFILTCNYQHKVIQPIQSRCQIVNLTPPLEGIIQRIVEILKLESIKIGPEQKELLLKHIQNNLPDLRRIINDVQKFSANGSLHIKKNDANHFAEKIYKKLSAKENVETIRKFIIENEKDFSRNYQQLLKQLFETIFVSSLQQDKKIQAMLLISKGLELDAFVVDKEINCFSTIINLYHNIF